MNMLEVTGLCKHYGEGKTAHPVINGINLSVEAGQQVALLGASGSGKTTLLNLLAGIDRADSGSVQINGQPILDLEEPAISHWRRRYLGFVFQFFNLIPTLTVAENIALPLQLINTNPADIGHKVVDLLEAIQLPGFADRFPDTLSGGEQQRVAIARALAHRPKLLLADEPTGNLDEETGKHILDLLVRLAAEHKMTMLVVTHSAQVAQAAQRRFRLHNGQLEES